MDNIYIPCFIIYFIMKKIGKKGGKKVSVKKEFEHPKEALLFEKLKNKSANPTKEHVLNVKKVTPSAEIPSYLYDTDVGFDLRADENIKLFPGEQKPVKTGVIFEIPQGTVGLIRDRVGVITQMGIHTCAGTFDSGFRGEVSIFLVNLSEETKYIEKGMRIAQMIIIPVLRPKIVQVKNLTTTERGEKSFGSTGFKELDQVGKDLKELMKGANK